VNNDRTLDRCGDSWGSSVGVGAKDGKNGSRASDLQHEMLQKQERTNALLEEVVRKLDHLR
jgi:hypothetical protein